MSRRALLVAGIALLSAFGCAGRREGGVGPPAKIGSYRAVIDSGSGEERSFRLLLWVAEPGRLHAEALSPTGSPEVVLDGGGGRIAVSLPRRRTAYVGEASARAMERLLGVPLSLDDLVGAVLGVGASPDPAVRIDRAPASGGGLPERIEIRSGGRTLRLVRRSVATTTLGEGTGTGAPVSGLTALPLEDLGPDDGAGFPGAEPGAGR